MTDTEIEEYRQRVQTLTSGCTDDESEKRIFNDLKIIAREVGASTRVLYVHPTSSSLKTSIAETPELIRNIHQALQTASMANMCTTASQGYKMATKASKSASIQFWVAAAIAFLSAVAAWVAAMRN